MTEKTYGGSKIKINHQKNTKMETPMKISDIAEICAVNEVVGRIKGIKILEIGCGCGSPDNPISKSNRGERLREKSRQYSCCLGAYEPVIAIKLSEAGADVTGIDLIEVPEKNYRHCVGDLVVQTIPEIVPNKKFDVVISHSFFESPELYEIAKHYRIEMKKVYKKICKGVYDVLLDRGIFILNPPDNDAVGKKILKECGFYLSKELCFTEQYEDRVYKHDTFVWKKCLRDI